MEGAETRRWTKEIVILGVSVGLAILLAAAVVAPRVRANRRAIEEGRRLEGEALRLQKEVERAKERLRAYREDPWFRQEIRFRELGGRS